MKVQGKIKESPLLHHHMQYNTYYHIPVIDQQAKCKHIDLTN